MEVECQLFMLTQLPAPIIYSFNAALNVLENVFKLPALNKSFINLFLGILIFKLWINHVWSLAVKYADYT